MSTTQVCLLCKRFCWCWWVAGASAGGWLVFADQDTMHAGVSRNCAQHLLPPGGLGRTATTNSEFAGMQSTRQPHKSTIRSHTWQPAQRTTGFSCAFTCSRKATATVLRKPCRYWKVCAVPCFCQSTFTPDTA